MSEPIIEVELDIQSDKSEKRIKESLGKAGVKAGDNFSGGFERSIGSGLRSALTRVIGIGGALAAALGSRASIAAAVRQEEAINSLNASLIRIGQFSRETSKDLQNFASGIQDISKVGDEAAIEALAFAQSLGASVEQSKQVVAAAVDLSAALNIDLTSAVRNVGKTLGGFAGELGEVIPELKSFTTAQLRNGEAIDLIAKKYDGFAKNQLRGFGGATAQLSNVFGDLLESIGKVVTENPAFIALVQALTQSFKNLISAIDTNRASIIAFINDGIARLIPFVQEAYRQIRELIDVLINGAPFAVATIGVIKLTNAFIAFSQASKAGGIAALVAKLGSIATVATGAAAAVGLIVKGVENDQKINNQIDRLQKKLTGFQDELKRRADGGESTFFEDLLNPIRGARSEDIASGITKIQGELAGLFAQLEEQKAVQAEEGGFFEKIFEPFSQENIDSLIERIKAPFEVARSEIGETGAVVDEGVKAINNSLKSGLVTGITQVFGFLGKSLAGAGGGFKAFLGVVLSALGDLAISIGTTVIGAALSIEALKNSLVGSPAAAIALGGALVAVGSALKVFSSSLTGGASSSPVGGFSESTPGGQSSTDATFDFASEDQRQNQQQVQLIVQGDILDSEDTGRRLIRLLNDNFESEASALTAVRFA